MFRLEKLSKLSSKIEIGTGGIQANLKEEFDGKDKTKKSHAAVP
jgi:hypothetical protein